MAWIVTWYVAISLEVSVWIRVDSFATMIGYTATCYMMQTDWKGNLQMPQQASVLNQCRMIHHICAKFPQPCPNRSLTFNRPGNSLSSLHTSHIGDRVPAATYVFDIVCTYHCTELKWKCLPPCWLEWVYYPMTSFTGWSVFTQRTPADCMNFWWLHHPL